VFKVLVYNSNRKNNTTTKDVYASNLCVWEWPYDSEFSQHLDGTCIYINRYSNTDFFIFYSTSLGSTPKSPNSVWEFTRNMYWSASQKKNGLIIGIWILYTFMRMCYDIRGKNMRVQCQRHGKLNHSWDWTYAVVCWRELKYAPEECLHGSNKMLRFINEKEPFLFETIWNLFTTHEPFTPKEPFHTFPTYLLAHTHTHTHIHMHTQ
jgi:hypothetical protein